jgi:TRAP-type C4-dicarboxylate transport system substrate-binding protein
MTTRRTFAASAVAFALAAGLNSGAVRAQTKWDLATYAPEGEFATINTRQFAEEVKKATGGALDINVHSNASLIKLPDSLRAVSTGQVPIVEFLLSVYGNEDPVFSADNLPFVAVGYDNAWKFYQAQKPTLEKKLASRGVRMLYSVPYPGQAIFTKEPLKSIDDLKGTKFRTFSPLTARLAELLGAYPTVISQPEVPQAFATGTINAMITSSAGGAAMKSWEFVLDQCLPPEERRGGKRARLPRTARRAKKGDHCCGGGGRQTRLGTVQGARSERPQDNDRQRHDRAYPECGDDGRFRQGWRNHSRGVAEIRRRGR